MPSRWYNMDACADDRYLQSICAYRKPYFMIYVYDEAKSAYKKYIKKSNEKCRNIYNCSIDDLYALGDKATEEQQDFLFWYEFKMPVGDSNCSMNKICRYVESQLDGYKSQLHRNSNFDYNTLKVKRRCTEEHRQALRELEKYYCECIKEYKNDAKSGKKCDKGDSKRNRYYLYRKFNQEAKEICPNDDERMNIILDITYGYKGNKQFCWDCIGEILVTRLEEMKTVYSE